MKTPLKQLSVILPLVFCLTSRPFAQQSNKPTVNPAYPGYTQIPHTGTNYGSTVPKNYVRTWTTKTAIQDAASVSTNTASQNTTQSTEYFDGLGRPFQTVSRWMSQGNDLIQNSEYDNHGRIQFQYLPFNSGVSTGEFDANWEPHQNATYRSGIIDGIPNSSTSPEKFLYSETIYEPSPLNRVLKTLPEGNSWVGSGKGTEFDYQINKAEDQVKIWEISNSTLSYTNGDITTNIPTIKTTVNNYPAGTLTKDITKDEDGHYTVEYKDLEGLLILKKVQLSENISGDFTGYDGWLSTYYIYDDFGQLRFVLPPKATDAIRSNGWLIDNSGVINELCFRYEYDHRNRLIAKKVPGADWVYSVYDVRDRQVGTQDGNQRNRNQWLVTLYDDINRPTMTGLYPSSQNPGTLQQSVTSNSQTPANPTPSNLLADLVLQNNGVSGIQSAIRSVTFENGFESGINMETLLNPAAVTGNGESTLVGEITSNKFPFGNTSNIIPLTYTYYDNYSWGPTPYTTSFNVRLTNCYLYYLQCPTNVANPPESASKKVRGLVTGSKIRVLEDPDNISTGGWNTTTNHFDEKGRIIQTREKRFDNVEITIARRLSFEGLNYAEVVNRVTPGKNIGVIATLDVNLYNYSNSKLSKKWVNGRRVVEYTYDKLNKPSNTIFEFLTDVGEGGDYASIESQFMTYNIRGWLTGINKQFVRTGQTDRKCCKFGEELRYETGMTQKTFLGGNISGQIWRTAGKPNARSYGYSYDLSNRMLGADFSEMSPGNGVFADTDVDFDVVMGDGINANTAYDQNGNILRMKQNGLHLGVSKTIDDLLYTYSANSNKLQNVVDKNNDATSLLGDFKTTEIHPQYSTKASFGPGSNPTAENLSSIEDYTYDINGNLSQDKNKGFLAGSTPGIQYNHLNLPYKITVTEKQDGVNRTKGTIVYIYDALGNKLSKQVQEYPNPTKQIQGKSTQTDYIAGSIFENEKLQFTNFSEGRQRAIYDVNGQLTSAVVFDFYLKDHLGNVRAITTDETSTPDVYQATMEPARTDIEVATFSQKVQDLNVAKPLGMDSDGANLRVAELDGANTAKRVGPGIILKVMAGDQILARTYGWYQPGADISRQSNAASIIDEIISGLVGGAAGGKTTMGSLFNPAGLATSLPSLINPHGTQAQESRPYAYINWVFLDDEQFKFDATNSNSTRLSAVTGGSTKNLLQANNGTAISITRNGYIYVFVSNESNGKVFFDDLRVEHIKGKLLEESHYYPFGLTMTGISSKALKNNYYSNRKGFNGNEIQNKEFSDGSGLDFYDFNARTYDQQIGRFIQVDPLVEDDQENLSPYHFSYDNPIRFNDADGKAPQDITLVGKNNSSVTIETDLIDAKFDVSSLGIDFKGNYNLSGDDVVQAVVDIGGVIDPTPTLDIIGGSLSAKSGDYWGAFQSALGAGLPFIGDLAKAPKIAKGINKIEKAIDAVKTEAKAEKSIVKSAEALPTPGKGKGTVSPGQRDPKRAYSKSERAEMLKKQDGKCVGCGETKTVDQVAGHHKKRHADGGATTPENGAAVCKDCHIKIHQ